jgi:hypothetical protein
MKKILLALFIALTANFSFAQITVTLEDVQNQYEIGRTYHEYVDTLSKVVNIGVADTGNVWNFFDAVDLIPAIAYTEIMALPSASPFSYIFPNADCAIHVIESGAGETGDLWWHLGISGNKVLNYGYGSIVEVQTGTATGLLENDPGEIEGVFPLTLGSSWSYSGTMTWTISLPLFSWEETGEIDISYHVDGAGTLILPNGDQVEALRLREVRHVVFEVLDGTDESYETVYTFFTKTGQEVSVSVMGVHSGDGEVLADGVMWCDEGVVDIHDDETTQNIPEEFGLKQNYPNPFNPTTTIQYSVTEPSNVKIKVYDVLGNEVATLVDEFQNAGVYTEIFNAVNLPSGNYFVRMQAGNRVDVKKMTLLK